MKKVLILDADGVLIFNESFLNCIKKALKKYKISEKDIYDSYVCVKGNQNIFYKPNKWISTLEEENEHWDYIYSQISRFICSRYDYAVKDIKESLLNEAVYFKNCEAFLETIQFLEKVSDKMDCYILTNAYPSIENVLKKLGITKYIKKIYSSSELLLSKPNKEIFEFVLSDIKISSKNCIFIDDNKNNVIVAQKLGIKSILMNRKTKSNQIASISSLEEFYCKYIV